MARSKAVEHYRYPKDLLALLELEVIQEWQLKIKPKKRPKLDV